MVEAICEMLESNGIEIAGRARDGEEALAKLERRHPAVAVVDLRMPKLSGVEIARRAANSSPETAVILYTAYGERALLMEAIDAGARGFLLKEAPLDDLVRAVELVAAGGTYVDPVLAGVFATPAAADAMPALTKREREVLRLAGRRQLERGDWKGSLHLSRDRADPPPQGDGEARRRHPDPGRRDGTAAVPDLLTGMLEVSSPPKRAS